LEEELHGVVDRDVDVGGVTGYRAGGIKVLELAVTERGEVLPGEDVAGDTGLEGLREGGGAVGSEGEGAGLIAGFAVDFVGEEEPEEDEEGDSGAEEPEDEDTDAAVGDAFEFVTCVDGGGGGAWGVRHGPPRFRREADC
jgi:hypothetical protein